MSTTLRIYLVHFDAPEWCSASVESIRGSRCVRPVVTVIDNGGAPLLLPEEVAVLRTDRNRGYSGAANLALCEWLATNDEFCVVGSHDVSVEADTLARLLAAARAAPDFGVLGPVGLPPRSPDGASVEPVVERDWVSGTLLLLRRACVEQVGAFDERFGSYVEDVEYCMRARDRGWRVGLVVDAPASEFGSASPRAHAWLAANRVLLRALRAKGWARIRGRVLLLALAAKSEARMLSARFRKRPADDARFFRDAWTRAFVASFRQPPRTARPSPHS